MQPEKPAPHRPSAEFFLLCGAALRRRPVRFLTDRQSADIRRHLATVLPFDHLASALFAIDWACAWAAVEIKIGPEACRQMGASRDHFQQVFEAANALRYRLAIERPLSRTGDLDWEAFDDGLARVIDSALDHVGPARPRARRGRPPLDWRDRVISVVFSLYPEGAAKKTAGSHFEQTVEIVLELLDHEVADIHSVIVDALKRRPSPPFTVRTTPRTARGVIRRS